MEGASGDATAKALEALSDYEPGRKYSFADLESLARAANDSALVDVSDNRFLNPASMIGEVLAAATESGQAPKTVGELVKCVYRSLAECYARAVRGLSEITGTVYTSINIVGGGSKDGYLNELTGEATGLEVIAGPVEGTAIGNLIVQMIAGGEFKDLQEARTAIAR